MSALLDSRPPTVLIVADAGDRRDGLAELIRDAGIPAAIAGSRTDLQEYLRTHGVPGLILLDSRYFPGESLDLSLQLQAHPALAMVPVVVLTARDHQVPGRGVDALLLKPVNPRLLLDVVNSYCRPKSVA